MSRLPKTRALAYFFLVINTVLWGFASPIIKYSLGFIPSATFLFDRFLIASIFFTPVYFLIRKKHHHKSSLWLLISLALLGTPLTLYPLFLGLNLTTAIEGAILVAASPFITVLGGLIFLDETLRRNEWIGLLIAIIGTFILVIQPLFVSGPTSFTHFAGNSLILFSNLIWSGFLLLTKKTKADPVELTYTSFLLSVPFFLLIVTFEKQPLLTFGPALPGIVYMAIFGSIVAFWAYQEGQKRIEASEAAIFSYLQPVFALPLAVLWLKEPLSPATILASVIIATGVFFSEKR